MKKLSVIFILLALSICGSVFAATCQKTGSICVEGAETRQIGGHPIYRDCWKYEDTYSCVSPNNVDNCAPVVSSGICQQMGSVCSETAFNGECLNYQNTYGCSAPLDPTPPKVTQLPTTYLITKDEFEQSQCGPLAANPNCTFTKRVCTQGPETRNINGLDVTRDCWEYTDTYMCASPDNMQSTCGPYQSDAKCQEVSSRCLDNLASGDCGLKEHTYKCLVKEATSTTTSTCDNGVCMTGYCETPASDPDKDFAQAISGMELAREAVKYFDPQTGRVFRGASSICRNKLGGLSNCCKADGDSSGASNASMFAASMFFVNEGIRYLGSQYMFDSLFMGSLTSTSTLASLYGGGGIFGGGAGSFYGISFAPASMPPFAFDPASFAAAIAVQIVMNYLECEEDEKVLAMRKNAGLCTYIDSWCSNKVLGACITKKESYCCYNSKLSRIINEQGMAQLGLGYGDTRNPTCAGFTLDELNSIDFAKIDMTEFFGSVVPKNFNTNLATDRVQQGVNSGVSNYFPQ